MLETLNNLFKNYVINKFHKPLALMVTFFIASCFILFIHNSIREDFHYEKYFYSGIFIFIVLFWVTFKYFLPYRKNKTKKTGLVVAIFSENYDGVDMKNKFIKELKRQIIDANLDKYFKIITLMNHHSEKIKTIKDVDYIHNKVNGHIYFYGNIQKEFDGENDKKYFLNIDGYVKHLPIPIPVSSELSFDFRALLPREINFNEFFELRGCKATAKIIYLTAKYVVGVASFLSGNPFLAFEMHKNLDDELSEYEKVMNDKKLKNFTKLDFKKIRSIKNKIPIIISNETFFIAKINYLNNKKEEALKFNEISLRKNNTNYSAWLLKAIIDFKIKNDPQKALESVKKAKSHSNGKLEWRYSWAFLHFWNKNYEEAYKTCKKIEEQYYPNEEITLNEVESFNLEILESQNIPQLYFWIGYLAYKKSSNLPKALEYFEKFIEKAETEKMNFLILKTNSFLIDIKRKMGNIK